MNNLKKIGLTALAGTLASVSVNAADLSVTGTASINLAQGDGVDSGNGFTMGDTISFSATQELDNGMTVTFTQALDQGVVDGGGLTVDMGDNGVFNFCGFDCSGVLASKDDTTPTVGEEAWGDVSLATPAIGGASSNDMFTYSHSSLIDGLTLAVAYVPSDLATGSAQEESSIDYGAEYTTDGGLTIGVAMGENNAVAAGGLDNTIVYANMTVAESFQIGFTNSTSDSEVANADVDFQAYGISFAASEELSLSVNMSTHDYENTTLQDQDAVGVSVAYVMGSMTFTANHNSVDNIAGAGADDRNGYNLNLAFAF